MTAGAAGSSVENFLHPTYLPILETYLNSVRMGRRVGQYVRHNSLGSVTGSLVPLEHNLDPFTRGDIRPSCSVHWYQIVSNLASLFKISVSGSPM